MNFLGLLILYGELRPLFKEYDLSFDKGVTLLAENEEDFILVGRAFRKMECCGCRQYKSVKKKISLDCNNFTMLHDYSRLDRSEDISDYLKSEEFFSILLTYGWVSDILRNSSYIIPFRYQDASDMMDAALADEIVNVVAFVAEHMDYIQLNLAAFCKSILVLGEKSCCYWFHIGMRAVLSVYMSYLLLMYSEEEAGEMGKVLQEKIECAVVFAEQAMEPVDILDAVIKSVWRYVENEHVIVGSLAEVEGEFLEALEKDKGILYSESYYFIPEQLFRHMCQPLLPIISLGEIKYRMAEAGALIYNKGICANNYTIKKVFYTAFGEAKRQRFVKLLRETFQADNALMIEEMGGRQHVHRENSRLTCYDGD